MTHLDILPSSALLPYLASSRSWASSSLLIALKSRAFRKDCFLSGAAFFVVFLVTAFVAAFFFLVPVVFVFVAVFVAVFVFPKPKRAMAGTGVSR